MTTCIYEVYAIRYAKRAGRRPEHFVGGDSHDDRRIVPGHECLMLLRYPVAASGLQGLVVRPGVFIEARRTVQ